MSGTGRVGGPFWRVQIDEGSFLKWDMEEAPAEDSNNGPWGRARSTINPGVQREMVLRMFQILTEFWQFADHPLFLDIEV